MGIADLIANDEKHFENLAIQVATNRALNNHLKEKIASNLHKLFFSQESVDAWVSTLESIGSQACTFV